MNQTTEHGHNDNLDIQPERPVFDVIKIMLDARMQTSITAPAMHLRPTGQTSFHQVFFHVVRDFIFVFFDEHRALGAGADQ